jgi:hypothetical protein
MIRLHARDHAELCEARHVGRMDVLRVLDAEAPVARTVLGFDPLEDVELRADRAVADGVHDDLEPCGVGALRPRIEALRLGHEEPAIVRRVGERLEHRRGVRAERAVDEALEPADAEPGVTTATRLHRVAQALPAA